MPNSKLEGSARIEKELETYWVTVPPECGWILVTVEGRKMGSLLFFDSDGHIELRVAGFHTGLVRWVGDQSNVLAVSVERRPNENRNKLIPLIRYAVGPDFNNAEISFLDDRYAK